MSELLKDKRILVTGVNGQVGRALAEELSGRCNLVTAARSGADVDLDLENFEQIRSVIAEINPDIVINPAAYTKVDQAEDEPELASKINGEAPGVMAEACKEIDALLLHYSTDYVFRGDGGEAYREGDPTDPINVYGQSKLEGEGAIQAVNCRHMIFRTCWVYDAYGRNFVNAILDLARKMEQLKVVNDQIGTPTSAGFIARVTRQVLECSIAESKRHDTGNRIYNLRPNGHCSWYDFATNFVEVGKLHEVLMVKSIKAVESSEFSTKAERPSWSVLDNSKLQGEFGLKLDDWQVYTALCLEQIYSEKN